MKFKHHHCRDRSVPRVAVKYFLIFSLFLSLLVGCGKKGSEAANAAGETLVPLQTGGDGNISYGLFHAVTHSRAQALADCDLILVLRDYGAKFVDMSGTTSNDFALRDSRGTNISFTLATSPEFLTLGKATIVHIRVKPSAENSQPWSLDFPAKGSAYASHLSLKDIRL
jgi:hypothetical protein